MSAASANQPRVKRGRKECVCIVVCEIRDALHEKYSAQVHPEASTGAEFNESLLVGRNEQLLSIGDMQLTKDRCEVMTYRRF
jgi:hypothetical protein